MILLPNVTPEMLDADFWLARLGDPDAPLLDAEGIRRFNAHVIQTLNLPNPLDLAETLPAETVREAMTPPAADETYFSVTGAPYTAQAWEAIQANMALDAIPAQVHVRWGLVTQRTPLRAYPSLAAGMDRPGAFFFDRFQGTTIDLGWPAAVAHTSADRRWYFALAPLYWGWVQAGDVALAEGREPVRRFVDSELFAVAVGSRAGVATPDGSPALAQMGTRLPITGRDDVALRVAVPVRDATGRLAFTEGYIAHDNPDWHAGYLPCTARTVLNQAFRLLGEPYAWGGWRIGGFGRDCSRMVQDVWATAGVRLPRNSRQQASVGVTALRFDPDDPPGARAAALAAQAPPASLLMLPGHVMLYLGAVNGNPYAIHDLWNFNHADGRVTVVGAVVVSDLGGGPSAKRHTLLERLTHVQVVGEERPA